MKIYFVTMEENKYNPLGNNFIRCHIFYFVEMEYLQNKYRLVSGDQITESPPNINYSNFVLHETVGISLKHYALNYLQVEESGVVNYYTSIPVIAKLWKVLSPNFREDQSKKDLVVISLYVLNYVYSGLHSNLNGPIPCIQFLAHILYIQYIVSLSLVCSCFLLIRVKLKIHILKTQTQKR